MFLFPSESFLRFILDLSGNKMMKKTVLRDDEIAKELENLFGIPDGTVSDDDLELPDEEYPDKNECLERVLTGNDILLSSAAINNSPSTSGRNLSSTEPERPIIDADLPPTADNVEELLPDFSSSSESDSDTDEVDWKKQEWPQEPNTEIFDSIMVQCKKTLPSRTRPIGYFSLFFTDDILKNIVEQTNLYASQSNNRSWSAITLEELKAFIGVLIQMGIHVLPNIEDYWSSDPLLQVAEIAETMTLKRFQQIMKCLHINNNTTMPNRDDPHYDKLYKIRPLIDGLNLLCQENATTTYSQSIDECMIKFKGRSSLKQYMPMKPVKRGYKVWIRADSATGYVYMFQIYTGKADTAETGLGSKVVKTLCEPLIETQYPGHIAFDNFFSSAELLQFLHDKGIYATSTVRSDRVDLPLLVKKPKLTGDRNVDAKNAEAAKREISKVKKLKRGKYKWRVKKNVGFAVWKDTKQVTVLTTAFHPRLRTMCRRTQKDGSKKSYRCPKIIPEYTKRMGGVDRFDQKRSTYIIGRRGTKWWRRIFYFLLDLAITNAYILYKNNTRVHSFFTQKTFRIALSRELINNLTFRKRSFQAMPKFTSKKTKVSTERQKTVHAIPDEIRLDGLGEHWPEEISTFRRCRLCSTKTNNKRSKIQCDKCKVTLCITPCFKQFHFSQ